MKRDARGQELMINLGRRDDESVSRELRGEAANRRGHLVDFRIDDEAWIASRRDRPEYKCAHRPARGLDIGEFVVLDDHLTVILPYSLSLRERVALLRRERS